MLSHIEVTWWLIALRESLKNEEAEKLLSKDQTFLFALRSFLSHPNHNQREILHEVDLVKRIDLLLEDLLQKLNEGCLILLLRDKSFFHILNELFK